MALTIPTGLLYVQKLDRPVCSQSRSTDADPMPTAHRPRFRHPRSSFPGHLRLPLLSKPARLLPASLDHPVLSGRLERADAALRLYQAAWGFSPITITVVFGIYALAVLAALLVVGALSDYVGRRPVLLAATLLQAVTMVIFATAHGVGALVVARVIQGLSTGAAAGAVGAGMLDLDRAKGTIANAVGPMLGTATGALVSGLMVVFCPRPRRSSTCCSARSSSSRRSASPPCPSP